MWVAARIVCLEAVGHILLEVAVHIVLEVVDHIVLEVAVHIVLEVAVHIVLEVVDHIVLEVAVHIVLEVAVHIVSVAVGHIVLEVAVHIVLVAVGHTVCVVLVEQNSHLEDAGCTLGSRRYVRTYVRNTTFALQNDYEVNGSLVWHEVYSPMSALLAQTKPSSRLPQNLWSDR